ncbi:MAG: hypothetical protein NC302_05915 [Bacteroidales bacterium]|nr:hypothetical protein [Bacteroidales bacterium]MCM1417136.1 hypothetical protein [bacterium]MCM1423975.1 hypothetical protein [bacterium]
MKSRIDRIVIVFLLAVLSVCAAACGKREEASDALEGSLQDIMASVAENADLEADFRESLAYYETAEITDDLESYVLGTDAITYTEGVVFMPMMSSTAFQCVLLRVDEADVETAKETLREAADPNKWVCVSAETTLIESRGNVIFFIMAGKDEAYAFDEAFQGL